MKFARPRKLQANTYNDLTTTQPELFHVLCNKIIYPPENSERERYILRSIEELKTRAKTKNKAIKLNSYLSTGNYILEHMYMYKGDRQDRYEHTSVGRYWSSEQLDRYENSKKDGNRVRPMHNDHMYSNRNGLRIS
jgi:hypothetical protein